MDNYLESLSAEEVDYYELLLDSLDDGIISSDERRFLDKQKVKLNINDSRALELESIAKVNVVNTRLESLSAKEVDYYELLLDSLDDGIISSDERRFLDKQKVKLNINDSRALELESIAKVNVVNTRLESLTTEEMTYYDLVCDSFNDGNISNDEMLILNKRKTKFGISDERAIEIENMAKASILGSDDTKLQDTDKFIEEAIVLWQDEKNEEAIKLCDKAIEIDSDCADAYCYKGLALADLEKHGEAIICYDKAIELVPNYTDAYNGKGSALYNLGRYEWAIKYCDKAIAIDPNYANAYYLKGNALANLEKYGQAIICYDKTIELVPNYANAYYAKGNALANLGRYEGAIKCYDMYIELDPNYAYVYYNKGLALYNLERHEEAVQCYDMCIELDPNYADAYHNKEVALDEISTSEFIGGAINFAGAILGGYLSGKNIKY